MTTLSARSTRWRGRRNVGRLIAAIAVATGGLPAAAQAQAVAEDGTRLAVRVLGAGDTIIVVHGGPALGSSYLVPGLAPLARRHTLVFFDQRGAGRSAVPDSTRFAIYDYVNDIEAVRRYLGLERVTVLGHSWGGALAALYAAAYPQHTRSLVLLAPMPPRALWADSAGAAAQRALDPADARTLGRLAQEMLRGDDPVAACDAQLRLLLRIMAGQAVADDVACDAPAETIRVRDRIVRWTTAPLAAWDWRGTVAWIETPTLVVHGELDTLPAAAAREWAGTIAGARLLVIPGAHHLPHLTAPERFQDELERFLSRRPRR